MGRKAFLGAALVTITVGATHAQDRLPGEHLVTITVAGDRDILAHTIRIEADTFRTARSQEELDRRVWRASRVSENGEEQVDSETCPALRQVAHAFAALPDLSIAPPTMQVVSAPLPVPPTMKDGYSTRLTFRTVTLDGSEALVELRHGNAYAEWANSAVGSLAGCWGPPAPSPGRQ
ncbi:MAG: hypothetical protein KL785_09540 [Brevundimonas sp.]|nr:hypothetical protein [Brevundimonas sp.]